MTWWPCPASTSTSRRGSRGAARAVRLGQVDAAALLAGLLRPSAGRLRRRPTTWRRPADGGAAGMRGTDVGVVLQGAVRNLLPYVSPTATCGFAQRGVPPAPAAALRRPRPLLDLVGLADPRTAPVRPRSWPRGSGSGSRSASAIATGPGLLLLDEPTSQLDTTRRTRCWPRSTTVNGDRHHRRRGHPRPRRGAAAGPRRSRSATAGSAPRAGAGGLRGGGPGRRGAPAAGRARGIAPGTLLRVARWTSARYGWYPPNARRYPSVGATRRGGRARQPPPGAAGSDRRGDAVTDGQYDIVATTGMVAKVSARRTSACAPASTGSSLTSPYLPSRAGCSP